jgi:hypothetical protein
MPAFFGIADSSRIFARGKKKVRHPAIPHAAGRAPKFVSAGLTLSGSQQILP